MRKYDYAATLQIAGGEMQVAAKGIENDFVATLAAGGKIIGKRFRTVGEFKSYLNTFNIKGVKSIKERLLN